MDKRTFRFIQDYAGRCKGKMSLSVICSVLSVCAGFIPYIAVYRLLICFLDKQVNMDTIFLWCMVCFGGYFLKLLFFEISTLLSHISAYTILEMIRLDISDKLLKLPLGFVINKPIGKLKNIMIDRVETIELPLAHLIPEGIAYALAPIGVFIYLLSIHWGMALASLITIPIGGVDIKEIPLSKLFQIISYVAQDNYLFNCSLKENIRLGNPKAFDEEVYKAAKEAMCHEFIMNLENGYDTMAGEAGDKLSGGEKQRIATARMILRNAPIIILDEATAFTDPENEDKIQQAIGRLTKGKTLLVIAHRLSTIKHADQILVMDKGRIVQRGTHKDLIEEEGIYRKFIKIRESSEGWSIRGAKA